MASVERSPNSWSDHVRLFASRTWIHHAKVRVILRVLGEVYDQQLMFMMESYYRVVATSDTCTNNF